MISGVLMKINCFKRLSKLALFLFGASLLNACANIKNPDAPVPINFPHSTQQHLQASQHWAIVAADIADQILIDLTNNHLLDKPVYVNSLSSKTEFNKALNDFLITELVKNGVKVSRVKEKNIVLDYKAQVVKFKSSRDVLLPSKLKWTSLAGGLVVGRLLADAIDINTFDGLALTGGAVADLWITNQAPNLELVVTSSIVSNQIYVSRATNLYYANVDDIHLYEVGGSNSPFNDPFYRINK